MISKHITKLMKDMNRYGIGYAYTRCYAEKAINPDEAYLLGFIDACASIRKYIIHHNLDKLTKGCYTSRKAHKK
jgi:hypothetical protein